MKTIKDKGCLYEKIDWIDFRTKFAEIFGFHLDDFVNTYLIFSKEDFENYLQRWKVNLEIDKNVFSNVIPIFDMLDGEYSTTKFQEILGYKPQWKNFLQKTINISQFNKLFTILEKLSCYNSLKKYIDEMKKILNIN